MRELSQTLARFDVKRGSALKQLARRGLDGGVTSPKITVALSNVPMVKLSAWAKIDGVVRKKTAVLDIAGFLGKDEELVHRRVAARATKLMKDMLEDVPLLESAGES
tara:strand:- start:208 stop:528 length:321 start_codon:yes stop_codon:yes gene_type:complete